MKDFFRGEDFGGLAAGIAKKSRKNAPTQEQIDAAKKAFFKKGGKVTKKAGRPPRDKYFDSVSGSRERTQIQRIIEDQDSFGFEY